MSDTIPKAYPFDRNRFEVKILAVPANPKAVPGDKDFEPKFVHHALRRPTVPEVLAWEKSQSMHEQMDINKKETRIVTPDDQGNIDLWNLLILEVKGYQFKDAQGTDWRPADDYIKAKMPVGHKLAAVYGLYLSETSIKEDEADGVIFDQQLWTIEQRIGTESDHYLVTHVLREPDEKEVRKYRRNHTSQIQLKGGKNHTKVVSNLKVDIDTYDLLVQRIESGGREAGKEAIDPIFKRKVVDALMDRLDGTIQD